jgi:integral membrane protein
MNWLKQFKVLAIAEGISYLLFGLTMPLKYVYEVPEPNYYVGMAHGVLFILYCIWAIVVAKRYNWSFVRTIVVLAASLLPIATFIVERKVVQPEIEKNNN